MSSHQTGPGDLGGGTGKPPAPAALAASTAGSSQNPAVVLAPGLSKQLTSLALVALGISACFFKPLWELVKLSVHDSLASHACFIPVISGYLVWIARGSLPVSTRRGLGAAVPLVLLGLAALGRFFMMKWQGTALSANDALSLTIFSYVCFVVAGASVVFGRERMVALWFPAAFLIFMVPMPEGMVNGFEMFLQRASAELTSLVYTLTGTVVTRVDALTFKLPTITITVAQECSGIRSTYVLFITSLLAGYLFFRRPGSRLALALAVIPLGLARNAFRIFVISMLCVHVNPDMINSPIHRKGGPLFFAISLVPLFLLLFWLRRRERRLEQKPSAVEKAR